MKQTPIDPTSWKIMKLIGQADEEDKKNISNLLDDYFLLKQHRRKECPGATL